ncbi:MAG: glycoside hydrolase family 2 [Bacteroidales bacterium]|nr:glycoside hydrolase family 2 [Bacteroidales bacterium]
MKLLKPFILLLGFALVFCQCQPKTDGLTTEQLYEGFQQPTSEYRPFVRWWWNGDKVEADELVRELRLLKEAGIGGVEINPIAFPTYCDSLSKPSLQWLSPEWIDMLKVSFDEAKRLDMTCDLLVGSGWPFGAEFLDENERAQIVVNYAETVTGPTTLTLNRDSLCAKAMPKVSSPYKGNTKELMMLRLYPNPATSVDDGIIIWTAFRQAQGPASTEKVKVPEPVEDPIDSIITIQVPEGEYTLAALMKINGFLEVINGAPGAAGPVLDHFNTEAVNRYLYNMSDKIEAQIGPLQGNIRALFTDSMELEGANWTSDMAEEFQKRYGYDITEWLPFILFKIGSMGSALNYDPVIPVTDEFQKQIQRARYDFEDFKAQLMTERFTQTYLDWCHQLGVKARAQAYGRGFYPLENAMGYDIPEGESWTTNWLKHKPGEEMSETDYRRGRAYTMVNKFVSSAAHLADNRTISCEEMTNTYTVFNMTLEQLKIGGDQSAMSGVTHSVFHGFNYSPNLEAKFPGWVRYGAYYSENNNWWPYFKYYNDYKARLSYTLQHGTYYADIAILNPENDMWSTIGMQNEPFPNTTRAPYKTLIWEAINKCGGGVDYVSENIINQSDIKRGNLCYNKRKYNTLMLIDVESLHPETAEQLLKFVETGGKIVCIDTIPYQSLGLRGDYQKNDSLVKATMDKVIQHQDYFVFVDPPKEDFIGWYDSLMRQIPPFKGARGIKLPHYIDIESPDPYVMQNRYTTDDGSEMVLLCNSHRYNAHQTKITFSKDLTHKRQAQIWDLQTGKRYALPLDKDGSYTFDLGPVESVLVVFEKSKPIDLPIWQPLHQRIKDISYIDLSDNWDIELRHSLLHDTTNTHFDTLFDLKDSEDYQHFCGTIVYRKTLDMGRDAARHVSTILDLGLVEGVSEVFINGQSAGVQYFGRRIYDITDYLQKGENDLEVRVTTTMGNYLKTFNREENPTTWVYVNHPRRDQPLQPIGLIGPVKIYKEIPLRGMEAKVEVSSGGGKCHKPSTN